MDNPDANGDSQVIQPKRALPKKYLEPILYLADRMSSVDKEVAIKEVSIIVTLAEAANKKNFQTERWFKEFTQEKACAMLDIDAAKRGALVVMSLVLKADKNRLPSEHEYFTKIRKLLGAEAVAVPIDMESHTLLALLYLSQ